MGYVAYDPDRLAALTAAMRTAHDELSGLRCDDPSAADAVSTVRLAQTHLEQTWLPLVNQVVSTDPLGGRTWPIQLDGNDLFDRLLKTMRDEFGWIISVPIGVLPFFIISPGPLAPPSVEETVGLADALQRGNVRDLVNDPAERQFLAIQLVAIAADPALAELFDQHFDRWGALADELGDVRVEATATKDPDAAVVGDIDQAFKGIAGIATSVHGSGSIPQLTREMDPYSAAVLVSQAGVDPDMLPWLSFEILHRYIEGHPPMRTEDLSPGPKTADILFQTILATEGAPTKFVLLASDEPEVLWWTAADSRLAQQVAAVGTDPANITGPEAHVVIHSFVNWFDGADTLFRGEFQYVEPPTKSSRAFLGALAAPWFVEFGPGTTDWGPDDASRYADLADIIDDPEARDALLDAMNDRVATISPDTDSTRYNQAVGAAIGMLTELEVERQIRDAKRAKEAWDGGWSIVQKIISVGSKIFGPEVAAIAQIAVQGSGLIKKLLEESGWLGAPPPVGDVAERVEFERDRILITASAVSVNAAFQSLAGDAGIKPGAGPPPLPTPGHDDEVIAYWDRYNQWKDVWVVPGSNAELRLDAQFHLFFADAQVGARAPH